MITIALSKYYTCPVCEGNWTGRNLTAGGEIPQHWDRTRTRNCEGVGTVIGVKPLETWGKRKPRP